MQNEKPDATLPDRGTLDAALCWLADMICLWSLCGKAACRRARRCRREPRDCLARYAPLVPDDVRAGVKLMLEGLDYGLSYDDLREDAPDEIAAVETWIARVDASRRQ